MKDGAPAALKSHGPSVAHGVSGPGVKCQVPSAEASTPDKHPCCML